MNYNGSKPNRGRGGPDAPREDYFDDWNRPAERPMTEAERRAYYAERDAYYASRDAYYAQRDAYYARREAAPYPPEGEEYCDGEYDEYEDEDEEYDEEEYAEDYEDEPPRRQVKAKAARKTRAARRRTRRRRRRRRHPVRTIIVALILAGIALLLMGSPPVRNASGADRSSGRSNILLAGTDESGLRTDTIMLLSLERGSREIRLLSIPRDTYAPDYAVPKINSAYGAAGTGERGMEELMRQTEKVLGFAPDGYVLVDLDCVAAMVDLLGGVDFNVPEDMHYEDYSQNLVIDLRAGMQHLSGREALWVLRYRSGYATADIGRTEVQREFIKEAMRQWARPDTLKVLPELWQLYRENMVTDLEPRNVLWIARVLLKGDLGGMTTEVLPGWADMVGGASVYMIDRTAADLMLKKYDPYSK